MMAHTILEGIQTLIMLYGVISLRGLLKQFPPHRHVGERIVYPKDFEPAREEVLHADRNS